MEGKSFLGRLADKIDPGPTADRLSTLPVGSRIARRVRGFLEQNGVLEPKAKPTTSVVTLLDNTKLRYYTDGSLRYAAQGLKGHARKVAKRRLRRLTRRGHHSFATAIDILNAQGAR